MSSIVLYDKNGVVMEWHKAAPYTVRFDGKTRRYATREAALRAAKRLVARVRKQK